MEVISMKGFLVATAAAFLIYIALFIAYPVPVLIVSGFILVISAILVMIQRAEKKEAKRVNSESKELQ
jgi:hypothetical protein